ncbi:peptidoglycan -binding protein [Halovulum sp. GXIMD14793]
MAALRKSRRQEANIWPGFVDAMTALLLILMFVLSIFMIIQFVLRDTIVAKETELDNLGEQVAELADALGLEQQRTDILETGLGQLNAQLAAAEDQVEEQSSKIADFEAQVASLSTEIDTKDAAARLAAAQREAMEALLAELRAEAATTADTLSDAQGALDEAEAQRLADAEAARLLRERLENADAELTAMTLSLEAERRKAEETLSLLAAAEAARDQLAALSEDQAADLTEAQRRAALLAKAREELSKERDLASESQKQVTLLNQQTTQLNRQLRSLQQLLDEAEARDEAAQVQLDALGQNLNTALAQVAQEQRRRAELEEAERKRLGEEAKDLANYRSEFFGRVREILGDREGVQVVGDRFVFSSEVLFDAGSATLGEQGRQQIAQVAAVIREIRAEIPAEIDWILRVDGHTDNIPLFGGRYADNWELSQARALSVVKYLIETQDIDPKRLAANGFGEFQPVDPTNNVEARARNRRIELKFTER